MLIQLPRPETLPELFSSIDHTRNVVLTKDQFLRCLQKEITESADQVELIGLATILIVAANQTLKAKYGGAKSILSTEGWSFIGRQLPSYIAALVSDEESQKEVYKLAEEMPMLYA